MCVESISFVGKYVPIDTGTETRGRRNTQKVLHNVNLISPRLINVLTKRYSGMLDTLTNTTLKAYLANSLFPTEHLRSGKLFHGFRRGS